MAEEEKSMMGEAATGTDADAALSEQDRAMLVGLNEQRENMYGLLSRLYKVEMDEDFYKGLCEAAFPTAPDLSKTNMWAAPSFRGPRPSGRAACASLSTPSPPPCGANGLC